MTKTFKDNCDINIVQQTSLRASFSQCSNAVKNILFRSFCTSMYASQLWCDFRKACMQRLHVAYKFGCRALYNLPRRASVSSHQVQCNIPTFEALLRKNVYLFLERCKKSNNVWLRAVMQSDCLYSSLFFETTTPFYFVTECSDVTVLVWGRVKATAHSYFTWPWPGLDSNSYHAIFVSYSGCSVVPSVTTYELANNCVEKVSVM